MPTFTCPQCGSKNVKVSDPSNPILGELKNLFGRLGSPSLPRGTVIIECRDCGHKGVLHIN